MQIDSDKEKTLIVYFSHSGNTRRIAEQIHRNIGGDLIEIETIDKYGYVRISQKLKSV